LLISLRISKNGFEFFFEKFREIFENLEVDNYYFIVNHYAWSRQGRRGFVNQLKGNTKRSKPCDTPGWNEMRISRMQFVTEASLSLSDKGLCLSLRLCLCLCLCLSLSSLISPHPDTHTGCSWKRIPYTTKTATILGNNL